MVGVVVGVAVGVGVGVAVVVGVAVAVGVVVGVVVGVGVAVAVAVVVAVGMTEPMTPIYIPDFAPSMITIEGLLALPWEQHRPTRRELFMSSPPGVSYTYGQNQNAETYVSVPVVPEVAVVMALLNEDGHDYNGCFLNLYEDEQHHLGWHADDFAGMDPNHPIASVSFGAAREIWWRPFGFKGTIPPEWRRLLLSGSAFIMPAGFQETHQHRIPKCDRPTGPRVSMTFRRFL